MSNQKPKNANKKRVTIEIPKELSPTYANIAFITHTPAELIIDFAQVFPRMPKGQVVSRMIMSPIHAKAFLNALNQNINNYERQFGEIKMPQQPHLADQLFRFPPPTFEGDDDNAEDGDESK